ncbi:hypothetical protein TNCV_4347811 [Trichonephila clavipes]|nr:hypothetical protein TNCV_4347811 [Trichonephila clavipes]
MFDGLVARAVDRWRHDSDARRVWFFCTAKVTNEGRKVCSGYLPSFTSYQVLTKAILRRSNMKTLDAPRTFEPRATIPYCSAPFRWRKYRPNRSSMIFPIYGSGSTQPMTGSSFLLQKAPTVSVTPSPQKS